VLIDSLYFAKGEDMNILVINCGSSSLKFSFFLSQNSNLDPSPILSGLFEKISSGQEILCRYNYNDQNVKETLVYGDHSVALKHMLELMAKNNLSESIEAIGHRFVHGGMEFKSSVILNEAVKKSLEACLPLAPLHNPANFTGIELILSLFPTLPQVVVFDTAFHSQIPEYASRYALPNEYFEKFLLKKYGFHGTSHAYVSQKAAEVLNVKVDDSSFLSLHLGNGCSATAILNGKSVDTSMGFTPLEGLVMGTRSGDIDAGAALYLMKKLNLSADDMESILNKKSGLLGISNHSNDLRELKQSADSGNQLSMLALEVFAYRAAQYVGKLMVALPTIPHLIFTGGIGENASWMREKIVNHLAVFGFKIDNKLNSELNVNGPENQLQIQSADSSAKIVVIATQEEYMIAQETQNLVEVCS
jgi:acetate kinase